MLTSSATRKVIVTDAVYSMDGDLAPLPAIHALAERYDAWLVIDDAHGFGVLGQQRPWQPGLPFQPAGIPAHPADGHPGQGGPGRWGFCGRLGHRHRIPAAEGSQLHLHYRRATGHRLSPSKSLQIVRDGDAGAPT